MAADSNAQTIAKAFSGLGVDETSLITLVANWKPDEAKAFRKESPFFKEDDERSFEKWDQVSVHKIQHEFLRFKSAFVLWTMHPWERDARLIKDAVVDGAKSYNVIVEIATTRSSEELLGAKKAYHSLFSRSIEEDLTHTVKGPELKLLFALVSAFRYEGPKVREDSAKSEAKALHAAITSGKKNPVEDDEVVSVISSRSKKYLKKLFEHYKEISGKDILQDLAADKSILKDAVQCLSNPSSYFVKVLDEAMDPKADENTREGLIRVVVTRADVDMQEIKQEYVNKHDINLTTKVEEVAKGNFGDLLNALLARSDSNEDGAVPYRAYLL